ncbi:MAG: cytochrome c biogenesis protein ResB, partial [Desulfofustis sp.]|nr:cytochrome c biogenesis protein ResB [Desulfofustis sp.]
MQNNNSIWQFFSSVKLALVTLFLIAVTSIIGTVIPQKEAAEFYVSKYG